MTPTNFRLTVHGKWLSSIGIMSVRGIEDVEGSINGDTFCDFLQRCLVPILQLFNGTNDRSVMVMDNTDSPCQ